MSIVFNFYALALLISGLVAAWVAWYSYRHRSAPGSKELVALMEPKLAEAKAAIAMLDKYPG